MYQRELAHINNLMGPTVKTLVSSGAIIAGGAITSIFSGSKINDFDIFFRTQSDLEKALASVPHDDKTIVTDCATSFIADGHRVQLIRVLTGEPKAIIRLFDFTICQAAYDGKQFFFGPDFMHHLAQRRLVFNIEAEFPVCSLYRALKFVKRGYQLSGMEAVKLGLRIQSLKIVTYADLRRQLMGIDTLFLKDLTDSLAGKAEKSYDLNEFLSMMEEWLNATAAATGLGDE